VTAFAVNVATLVLAIACALLLRIILQRQNKKLARGEHVEGAIQGVPGQDVGKAFRFLV
jgi:hypothetical protein